MDIKNLTRKTAEYSRSKMPHMQIPNEQRITATSEHLPQKQSNIKHSRKTDEENNHQQIAVPDQERDPIEKYCIENNKYNIIIASTKAK